VRAFFLCMWLDSGAKCDGVNRCRCGLSAAEGAMCRIG
jgi:hypothetical protein